MRHCEERSNLTLNELINKPFPLGKIASFLAMTEVRV